MWLKDWSIYTAIFNYYRPIPEVTLRDRSHNSNVAESSKNLTWHGRISTTGKAPISPSRARAHGSLDMANVAVSKEAGSSSTRGRTDSDVSRNSGSSSSNNSRSRRDSDNSSGSGEHEQRKGYYNKQQVTFENEKLFILYRNYKKNEFYNSHFHFDSVSPQRPLRLQNKCRWCSKRNH